MPKVARLPLISSSWPGILLNRQILSSSKIGHVRYALHWYDEMEQLSARTARTRHGSITVITRHDRDILDDSGPARHAAHFHGFDAVFCNTSTVACIKPVSRTSGIGPRRRRDCARGRRVDERAREWASEREGDAHVPNVYDSPRMSGRRRGASCTCEKGRKSAKVNSDRPINWLIRWVSRSNDECRRQGS